MNAHDHQSFYSLGRKYLTKRESIGLREGDSFLASFVARAVLFLSVFNTSTQCLQVRQNKSMFSKSYLCSRWTDEQNYLSEAFSARENSTLNHISYHTTLPTWSTARRQTDKGLPCKLDSQRQRNLKQYAANRVGVSQNKSVMRFHVSRPCIRWNLKKMTLTSCKRRRAPKYTPQELGQIPGKCRQLRREATDTETFIIVDDEKYFSFSGDNTPSNSGFYSVDRANAPVHV